MQQEPTNIKHKISLRVYLLFIVCTVGFLCVIGKIFFIQIKEGEKWRKMAQQYQMRIEEVTAPRGSIYADDGNILAISTARYSLYYDGKVSTLGEKQNDIFKRNIYATCQFLSSIRPQYTPQFFYNIFKRCIDNEERYQLIIDDLSFEEYQQIKKLPLIEVPSHIGGFILSDKEVRSFLYGDMARRTIGNYSKDYNGTGIESSYNRWLSGSSGKRITQKIGKGVFVPVDGNEIIPEAGNDIQTTLNIEIQDIASHALLEELKKLDADWGTCIVMEVQTGQIKAISNLKRGKNGQYYEEFNYAVSNIEPGSSVKTIALMAMLEDGYVELEDSVDISHGQWSYNGITIKDSEHGDVKNKTSVKHAFEISSNVGISKLVKQHYEQNPKEFFEHFSDMKISDPVLIQIPGEQSPYIRFPQTKDWSKTSLLWSSFGYELQISPISLLTFYNGIANGGTIMQPYLVKKIIKDHKPLAEFEPKVRVKKMCSYETLQKVKSALEGVVQHGTASVVKNSFYPIAGKTGTSKVYSTKNKYNVNHYLGSFVGYFPADHPKYSCIVFIQNKENSSVYYGASTALPVFKEVADRCMSKESYLSFASQKVQNEIKPSNQALLTHINNGQMPDMSNWKLSDAIYFCEINHINIESIVGTGRVGYQSIAPGSPLKDIRNQYIKIQLQ